LIKGGTLTLGNDRSYPEERRGPPVTVGSFYMDATEVTNRQFAEFVEATGYRTVAEKGFVGDPRVPAAQQMPGSAVFVMPGPGQSPGWTFLAGANWRQPEGPGSSIQGRENEPVVQIAYVDALAYARWKGRDLPTEAEWEWAAGQGRDIPGRARPVRDGKPSSNTWDGQFPTHNVAADGFMMRAPVASFPANPNGLYDMTGNVWEWTKSLWTPNHDPAAKSDAAARAVKGGSFLCAVNFCARYRPQSRQRMEDDLGTNHIGFRTIRRVAP
jgi:formylglycine-generating enzyme required for sulfatase activity